MSAIVPAAVLLNCAFVKETTPATLVWVLFLVGASGLVLAYLARRLDHLPQRALVLAAGVVVFELFTAPMWMNEHLGRYAYIYHDVSWVMTLAWTALILFVLERVDRLWPEWRAPGRFALAVALLLPVMLAEEIVAVQVGIRRYAPEVRAAVAGTQISGVPIEILYYVPVFSALVIAFYRYWTFGLDDVPLVPVKRPRWLRSLAIAFVAVFLLEVMTEPMVANVGFPAWSYIFHDVTVLLNGAWILLIAVGAVIARRYLMGWPQGLRFAATILTIGGLAFALEAWLIRTGHRVYGESAVAAFTGYRAPIADVPVEVAFAIPCYLALVVAFIRYWESVLDNGL